MKLKLILNQIELGPNIQCGTINSERNVNVSETKVTNFWTIEVNFISDGQHHNTTIFILSGKVI